jgi:hypothetical protein
MTVVDLSKIKVNDSRKAINWLLETWGPMGDRWTCKDLSRIEFRKERDATLFLLHWS